MIAKKRSALRALHELLRNDHIDKRYLALVKGKWKGGERRVKAPLRKNTLASGERIVRVDPGGKSARTHQIRVHATHIGHPLAGDEKYGSASFNREMRELGLSRLFLHAQSLRFRLREEGDPLQLEAPLPGELERLLKNLGKISGKR